MQAMKSLRNSGAGIQHLIEKHGFQTPPNSELIAIDFSSEMVKYAQKRISKFKQHKITLLKEDIFKNSVEGAIDVFEGALVVVVIVVKGDLKSAWSENRIFSL